MKRIEGLLDVTQFLRDRLLSDSAIRACVGERITPCMADQDDGSYIVITRASLEKEKTKQGYAGFESTVVIDILSGSYSEGIMLTKEVFRVLGAIYNEGINQPQKEGVYLPEFVGAVESFTESKYLQSLEYIVKV